MVTINPNPESPFVVVEFPQRLGAPMSVEEAKDRVALDDDDEWSFVAFAEGERLSEKGQMEEVMLFLYAHDNGRYIVFENWTSEWEEAVLIGRGGQENDRVLPPLSPQQALAQWIAGFMMKNEAVPGSHSLRYRLIES